jgi:prephenate dehydratase
MGEQVREVLHYSASIPDKVGEGARVLGALRDAGVNLTAFWGYPAGKGRAQLEFIPEDSAKFVAAAKQSKLKVRTSVAFYVHGADRPGAVADILKKLADARISLGALQAVCGGAGTYGAVIFLPTAAARRAASVLGAAYRP